jgi:hypothetical protein
MMDLAKHRIQGPQDSFYIPDFVTQAEEDYLLRKVYVCYGLAALGYLTRCHRLLSHPDISGNI